MSKFYYDLCHKLSIDRWSPLSFFHFPEFKTFYQCQIFSRLFSFCSNKTISIHKLRTSSGMNITNENVSIAKRKMVAFCRWFSHCFGNKIYLNVFAQIDHKNIKESLFRTGTTTLATIIVIKIHLHVMLFGCCCYNGEVNVLKQKKRESKTKNWLVF